MTDYLKMIKNWSAFYPEEQIFVGFLEDIHFYPDEVASKPLRFLGRGHLRQVPDHQTQDTLWFPEYDAGEVRRLPGELLPKGDQASARAIRRLRFVLAPLRAETDRRPPKEEQIPYPLWESYLWEEWTKNREFGMQSGPLPLVVGRSDDRTLGVRDG